MKYKGYIGGVPQIEPPCYLTKETVELLLTGVNLPEDVKDYIALVNKRLKNTESELGTCATCERRSEVVSKKEGVETTHCPIEEHYVLPRWGYCHLYEKEEKCKGRNKK